MEWLIALLAASIALNAGMIWLFAPVIRAWWAITLDEIEMSDRRERAARTDEGP